MTQQTLTFGTRGSILARRQTETVAALLQTTYPNLQTDTIVIRTKGDRELSKPLPQIGGKGLFTAELEAALHNHNIDLAVHSLKDLPTEDAPGLTIGAILRRDNPQDILVSRRGYTLETLPTEATVGTSSLRRTAQLLALRPDLIIESIRGNIDTRIKKALAEDGPYDAIVLAAAGLERMGFEQQISQYLPLKTMLPAPGQGAIAVQCRADDAVTLDLLASIDDTATRQAVIAERTFMAALNAGCSLPVAAFAEIEGGLLQLSGLVASLDGSQTVSGSVSGLRDEPQAIGRALAEETLAKGAQAILEAVHGQQASAG